MIKDLRNKLQIVMGMSNFCQTRVGRITCMILISGSFYLPQSFCQNAVDIKASVSGNLNCINTSVTLKCNSVGKDKVLKWTGPNGYVSTVQSPVTTMPGNYTVNISNPQEGTSSSSSVTVILDTIAPLGVVAASTGMLTCKDTLVTLNGNSTSPGVVYKWHGPKGFLSSDKNTETAIPGIYLLTVTNPVNGCISKANVIVHQDITPPENLSASASGVLNCVISNIRLIGTSSTSDVSYRWEGPDGTSSSISNPVVSSPGTFKLIATKHGNGCTDESSVVVKQDITKPKNVTLTVSDTLTCNIHSAQLISASGTEGVNYNWTGPDNFSSDEQNIRTNTPGKYTVSVTNLRTGCVTTKSAEVIKNMKAPEDLTLAVSGKLTCKDTAVSITTSSAISQLNYQWIGPGNFTSTTASPRVNIAGEYKVKATNLENGCSTTKYTTVVKDISAPSGVKAICSGSIDCNNLPVTLTGKCETEKVNYKWNGPSDFKSSERSVETTREGNYALTVTKLENGCMSRAKVTVAKRECNE